MDIKAIALLREREKALIKATNLSHQEILKNVSKTLSTSSTEEAAKCMLKVNDYSANIRKTIEDLRGKVNEYHMKIGEIMIQLSKDGFKKDNTGGAEKRVDLKSDKSQRKMSSQAVTKTGGARKNVDFGTSSDDQSEQTHPKTDIQRVKRENFDLMKANQLKVMQQIAKQQNELLQLMSETEKVITAVEEEGEISMEALKQLQINVNHYADTIETEEKRNEKKKQEEVKTKQRKMEDKQRQEKERKKREEEEKRRKEDEQRKEEEEKRRRKEEEERRKEEARRRKEEEQRKQEEERRRIEEEKRRKEDEQRRKEEEERRRKEEEERRKEETRRREEEEQRKQEEEMRRKEEEDRKQREEEERRKEEEERRRKEEEQKKREEEDRRKREEEERRKKEEEERKKEEHRKKEELRRKEAEKQRLNPDNWPTYRYMRKDEERDSNHMNISCLVCAIGGSNGFSKSDISCTESIEVTDLQSCLHRCDILQSNIIKLCCTEKDKISLEVPMRVYIPYKPTDASRETVLKIRINNEAWNRVVTVQKTPKDAEKDINWLGTEINNFKTLDIVVVSKLRTQIIPITPDGGTFTADADTRTQVVVPPDCVQWPASLKLQVANNLEKTMKNRRDLDNVSLVSVRHDLSCDSKLQKDATLQMFVDTTRKKRIMSHTKAIKKCREKLVDELISDSVLEYMQQRDMISASFCSRIKNEKEDAKTKAKQLVDYFETCSTKEFDNFIDALRSTNQTYLAQLLEISYDQQSSQEGLDFDADMQDSDFEGDIKVVVTGSEESETTVLTRKELNIDKNIMNINLPKGRDSYSVVGFIAPRTMDENDIRTTADKLQTLSMQMAAAIIIRQNKKDPSEVCIVCTLEDEMDKSFKDLECRGFVSGPKGFISIGIGDGEKVNITAVGNIEVICMDKTNLSLQFFSIKNPVETVFTIKEKNRKGKLSRGQYVGRIQFLIEGQGKTLMTDSVIVYLPVGDDFQRYAPIVLEAEVAVTAKHVAAMLTMMNQSPEKFLKDLAGNRYRQLDSRAKREFKTGNNRENVEVFIVNWAAQRPRRENKVREILDKMKRYYPELVVMTRTFVNLYNGDRGGILSTKSLQKIADSIEGKWEDVAKALQIDKNEIVEIKECFQNERHCAMRMLDQWRFSNGTIDRGVDVIEHFLSALRNANCSSTTIEMVKELSEA